ncbi:MAG: IS66-like element accessory protein TnpA [Vitreimonas sp.]
MDASSDASSFERPRRIEILTGVERRRRWSAEAKARIVAESLAPGAVVAEIARRHDIRASQIQLWRKQARDGGALALMAEERAFAPVIVAPPAHRAPRPRVPRGAAAPMIEIEWSAVGDLVERLGAEAHVRRRRTHAAA